MKRIIALLLTSIVSTSAYALPIGNPWEASMMCDGLFCEGYSSDVCDPCLTWCDMWSVRVGFYGDYVYNNHMKVSSSPHPEIQETTIYTNAGYLAINLCDRVDLFGTLGASSVMINTPASSFSSFATDDSHAAIASDTGFSWSVGLRGTLFECGCLGIGVETQYFQTRPEINYAERLSTGFKDYLSGDILAYKEWQIGLGAAYRVSVPCCNTALIPYVGVKWGYTWLDMNNLPVLSQFGIGTAMILHNLKNKREFGLAFGLTLLGWGKSSVTVEGRYIDQKALYVNAQVRF